MDDDFGDDQDFAAVAEAVERNYHTHASSSTTTTTAVAAPAPKVQQPKPQALPSRNAPSSILVSPRQKGNPILNNIRALPWEYSDIPPDFVLGATTCALFLSLKYHRLHPEYIYSRIRALQGKYNLRILLTMVDIQNHEESLKELSKTSLVNNLTLILCWSAQEAGKYLELYKSYEHASPTSIRAHQSTTYAEKLVEFITVPRSINKTDAVGLVSAFGSVRAAVNARPEEIGMITGWGEKKVQRWCKTVREPFRVRKAAKKGIESRREESSVAELSRDNSMFNEDEPDDAQTARQGVGASIAINRMPSRETVTLARSTLDKSTTPDAERRPLKRAAADVPLWEPGEDEEEALLLAAAEQDNVNKNSLTPMTKSVPLTSPKKQPPKEAELTDSMAAALARLRNK